MLGVMRRGKEPREFGRAVVGLRVAAPIARAYDLGARRYNTTGELLPDAVVEELRGYDAILLGAIGDPSVAPGILERGVLLPLRFVMDHHVNLRPVKVNDTLQAHVRVGAKFEFGKRAVIRRDVRVFNQRGELVQEGWHEMDSPRRPAT